MDAFPDAVALDTQLAADVARALREAIAARGAASLAVSGGSTPRGLFRALARTPLEGSRVSITLVDDRWVNADSPDSNARLVREQLLVGDAAAATFVPLLDATVAPRDGLAAADARLATLPWPLDVALLGMGNDGHTASLFPCADETPPLLEADCPARLAIVHPRTAPHARITMTLPALAAARQLWLHIVGDGKRQVLENALADGTLPVARVLRAAAQSRIYWTAHA